MASKVAPKAPYLNILDGSLIENDTLFNTWTRLLDHCSEYRINCDYCPNKHQCERIFSIISESVHHKNMSFDQLIKATERLLPLMKKKQLNLPIVKAIQFLYRELAYGPVPVAEPFTDHKMVLLKLCFFISGETEFHVQAVVPVH